MSPNVRRYLPMFVIVAALLFIVPALTRKKSNSSASSKTAAAATADAMRIVASSEGKYLAAHGRYSTHLADLVTLSPRLGADLSAGVAIALDVATGGKTFLAQVSSDQLRLVRSRNATKTFANNCTSLASGAKCPVGTSPTG
jgi:hypothetical protein